MLQATTCLVRFSSRTDSGTGTVSGG